MPERGNLQRPRGPAQKVAGAGLKGLPPAKRGTVCSSRIRTKQSDSQNNFSSAETRGLIEIF